MSTGIGYFLLGIFLDAVSLIMYHYTSFKYLPSILGLVSIVLIIVGVYKLNKYDKIIEQGRQARKNKKIKK